MTAMLRLAVFLSLLGCVFVFACDDLQDAEWSGKPWMGKWESTGRQENNEEFLQKLGIPNGNASVNVKVWHKFYKQGDLYHHKFGVPDHHYKNDIAFKLNEEGTGSFNNTEFKYKYTEQDGAIVGDFSFPTLNKAFQNSYKPEGEGMVKTAKIEGIEAKRWYRKSQWKCSNATKSA